MDAVDRPLYQQSDPHPAALLPPLPPPRHQCSRLWLLAGSLGGLWPKRRSTSANRCSNSAMCRWRRLISSPRESGAGAAGGDHAGGWDRADLACLSSGQPCGNEFNSQFVMFAQSWTDARHVRTVSGSTARALSSLCHRVIQSRASSTSGDDDPLPSPPPDCPVPRGISSGRLVFNSA